MTVISILESNHFFLKKKITPYKNLVRNVPKIKLMVCSNLCNNLCAEPDQPGFIWIRQEEEEGLEGRDLEVVEGVGEEVVTDSVSDSPITRRQKTQVLQFES
jgi:hypothetical protein